MRIEKLIELLSKLNPDAEIKIGGWREHSYIWDSEGLQEKHITFSRDANDKLTVHLEFDV